MAKTEIDDLWNDEDLLDFELPDRRHVVAARMRKVPLPGTLIAARWIIWVQAAFPVWAPLLFLTLRGVGDVDDTTTTTSTTTTTIAEQGAQGGGGGVFLLFLLGFIGLVAGLITIGVKLGKASPLARMAGVLVEIAVVLLSVRGALAANGNAPAILVMGALAVAALVCLLHPASGRAIVTGTADTSTRFDVRNLPTLDR